MNRKKKTVIDRYDDDSHYIPWNVDGIHSADKRAILNRLFQEQFTSMWTDRAASEKVPCNVAMYIRAQKLTVITLSSGGNTDFPRTRVHYFSFGYNDNAERFYNPFTMTTKRDFIILEQFVLYCVPPQTSRTR